VEPAYEAVIGLEIHAQLLTATKIFCGCPTAFGAPPNAHTCPVCVGLPGALPVLNRTAVDLAVTAASALGCDVQERSVFARKNYFYPDLPKGYQISQYEQPLATDGVIEYASGHARRHLRLPSTLERKACCHAGKLNDWCLHSIVEPPAWIPVHGQGQYQWPAEYGACHLASVYSASRRARPRWKRISFAEKE